jgi:hypothetical protein
VIPKSLNTWQNAMLVREPMEPSAISGRVVIETKFHDGDKVIFISRIRVFYN